MDVDTSSYPKAAPQVAANPLDTLSKIGGLQTQQQQIQSNDLSIAKQKLDLANNQFAIMVKGLTGLRNKPDLNENDIVDQYQHYGNIGLAPTDMIAKEINSIPPKATPDILRNYIDKRITDAQNIMEAVNYHLGQPTSVDNGQQTTPALQSPKFGIKPNGLPIQQQLPPSSTVATPSGTQQLGPQPPQIPQSTLPVQNGFPGQFQSAAPVPVTSSRLPVAAPTNSKALSVGPITNSAILGPSSNLGGATVLGATVEPSQAPIVPRGPMTSLPPMFDAGKQQLAQDQELATQKLTAIKPALQALPLLKDLRSGPGTEGFNKAVAFLKANNIISTSAKDDPTAIYQEVNKKLSQYVSSSPVGQRSDAAQTLAEASSPSPKTQINPALVKLTKDAIILDRVQAARPNAFTKTIKDAKGNDIEIPETDLSKYGEHRSTFPAKVDERAFGLDLMEPKERDALLDEMDKKRNSNEGKKFFKTLKIVDRLGYINTSGQ